MSVDKKEFWFRVAEKFGVPVVILAFVGVALVSGARWTADNVVSPLVNRHIRFIDTTEETMEKQASNDAEQTEALKQISQSTVAQQKTTDRMATLIEEFVDQGRK